MNDTDAELLQLPDGDVDHNNATGKRSDHSVLPQWHCDINSRLRGYRHGRSNRQQRRVIRIRSDGKGAGSKSARSTIGASDAIGAGQAWGKEELDIHGTYKANLVVVVGELLPDVPNNSVKAFKRMSVFDFDHHSILPTWPNLPIVVRRLDDERTNLFLLQDKKDGLCKIAQLPLPSRDKIAWYSEWTVGEDATQAKTRQNIWRNNISSFCKAYQEDHQDDFLDIIKTDGIKLAPQSTMVIDPFEKLISSLLTGWSLYDLTGQTNYIGQTRASLQDDLGEMLKLESTEEEAAAILRHLINSKETFEYDEAKEAASAYEMSPLAIHPRRS